MKFSFFILLLVSWVAADVLMKYGPHLLERGLSPDGVMTNLDDGHVALELKTPFIMDGEKFHTVYVNVDGLITFDGPSSSFEPAKLDGPYIAPFWADVDLTGELEDGNKVHFRVSENEEDTDWVRVTVQELSGSSIEWRPTTVVVATWDRVGHFMSRTDLLNTFQVVLATDGVESYAFSNYPLNGLNWWVSEQGQGSRIGYRTRNVEHSVEQSHFSQSIRHENDTRRMIKLDGVRPVLSDFVQQTRPCFFGGSLVTVTGFGFQPTSQDSLQCRFTGSRDSVLENLITSATFISSEEIQCQVPPMSPHQMFNLSVSINGGSSWSEPVTLIFSDCILSYLPVETCLPGSLQESSYLTVESFPEPWNAALQYSCKFGQIEVRGSLDKDSLKCQIPEFTSTQAVDLKVVVEDGDRKLESRKFGKISAVDCSFLLNTMEACTPKRRVVLIVDQRDSQIGGRTGLLIGPNGKETQVQVEGKVLELSATEDGHYELTLDNGRQFSFDIQCE